MSSIGEGGSAEEVICILEEVSGECLVEQMRAVPEALGRTVQVSCWNCWVSGSVHVKAGGLESRGLPRWKKEGILKVQDAEVCSGSRDGREDCIRVRNSGVQRDDGRINKA